MTADELADEVLDLVVGGEYAVRRFHSITETDQFRRLVRVKARLRQMKIRTALFNDSLLAVAAHDAGVWNEPLTTLRARVTAPS